MEGIQVRVEDEYTGRLITAVGDAVMVSGHELSVATDGTIWCLGSPDDEGNSHERWKAYKDGEQELSFSETEGNIVLWVDSYPPVIRYRDFNSAGEVGYFEVTWVKMADEAEAERLPGGMSAPPGWSDETVSEPIAPGSVLMEGDDSDEGDPPRGVDVYDASTVEGVFGYLDRYINVYTTNNIHMDVQEMRITSGWIASLVPTLIFKLKVELKRATDMFVIRPSFPDVVVAQNFHLNKGSWMLGSLWIAGYSDQYMPSSEMSPKWKAFIRRVLQAEDPGWALPTMEFAYECCRYLRNQGCKRMRGISQEEETRRMILLIDHFGIARLDAAFEEFR